MKDLTHYFQSPNKIVNTNISSSEDCVIIEKSRTPNSSSSGRNGSVSPFEKACKSESINIINTLSVIEPEECRLLENQSEIPNGRRSLKTSRNSPDHVNGIDSDEKLQENCEQLFENSASQSKETSLRIKFSDNGEKCSPENTPLNTQVSPNAFQILMSTQQIFSSTNSGKKEGLEETVENDSLKHENRKKIKENLEKMAKRKLEMEANIHACEHTIEKPAKKRRRIIVESDSENETNPETKSIYNAVSDEVPDKRRKRHKLDLKVAVKSKEKKSDKLCDDANVLSPNNVEHLIPRKLSSKTKQLKNSERQESNTRKSKDLKVKVHNERNELSEQKVSTEQSDIDIPQNGIIEKNTIDLEVKSNVLGKEKCNEADPAVQSTDVSSESPDATKKKSNILNYFNKVNSEVKKRHSEKIKITVDVHFPVFSTNKISKKVVTKKKSKRRGQDAIEDDIQLIASEMIEKPDLPSTEAEKSSSIGLIEERNRTPLVGNKRVLKMDPVHTPPHKDWKLRIRMPSSSTECTPSPVKQCKKHGSPLKKRKLKLSSGKLKNNMRNHVSVKIVPENEPDEVIKCSNSPKKVEKEKTTIKKKLSSTEEHSVKKSKMLRVMSSPEKIERSSEKDNCITENEKEVITLDCTLMKKHPVSLIEDTLVNKQSVKSTNSTRKGKNASLDDKRSTKVKDSTPKGRQLFNVDSPSMLKSEISDNKRSPLTKRRKQEEELSTPKKTASASLKTNIASSLKDTPPKKYVAKKKAPVKKSPVKNESTVIRNLKKGTVTSKRNVKSDENPEEKEEALSFVERDESFDEREDTPASGRAKRRCTIKNKVYAEDDDYLSQKSNQCEMLVSAGRRGTSRRIPPQEKKNSSVKETSKKSESYKTCTNLRSSPRKKITSLVPDYGISDEDEDDCEDFGSDSDDDFFGDSDDFGYSDEDFNSNSDTYNDDDDDDDEPIILVKKKDKNEDNNASKGKRAVSKRENTSAKGIMLDQKVVLQFLEKAKGTLNRKMALHNSENFPSTQSADAEEIPAPVKLAPLFVTQKTEKPDRATLMARKTFLQSGVPEVVKKMVETQKLAEEQDHVEFPSISHIQQRGGEASIWNLSEALLKFSPHAEESFLYTLLKMPFKDFTKCDSYCGSATAYSASRPPKIRLFREFLHAIKAESPDFPVYRTFRYLFGANPPQKTDSVNCGSTKRGRRKSNLISKKEQGDSVQDSEQRCAAWTAKYRPLTSSDILGNGYSVGRFKKWLELWAQVKENTFQKNFKEDLSSGDEFLNDSGDESGKTILPKQTVVLMGPTGSGKTMTVYTLARELGYKVLEVNAASKRTGRRILSELQEATQSHQVHGKGDDVSAGIKSFFTSKGKSEKSKPPKKKESDQQTNKLSLILIEDVDIVFEEEDEGFVSALSTLVIGSKRPVVLVTSDSSCPHLSRFLEKSLVLEFKPAPSKLISVWMQLVSLLEGVRVRKSCMEELLRYNKGDARKTLLQLQFWVLSGGNNHEPLPESSEYNEILDFPDDMSNSSWVSIDDKKAENQAHHPLHSQCLITFLELDPLVLPLDRGKTWWNMPKLVGLNEITHQVLQKEKPEHQVLQKENGGNICNGEGGVVEGVVTIKKDVDSEDSTKDDETSCKKWKSVCSLEDVKALVKLSDTLSVVETLSDLTDCVASEPYQCAWEQYPVDSLSLSQNKQPPDYGVKHTTRSIASWLVSTTISQSSPQLYPEKCVSVASVLQQQPPMEEMIWREQQHNASKELENAVATVYWSQRRAMTMDYISCLRNISRLEQDRGCVNDKRNNRFFHYLKGLGAHLSPAALNTVCNVFKVDEQV